MLHYNQITMKTYLLSEETINAIQFRLCSVAYYCNESGFNELSIISDELKNNPVLERETFTKEDLKKMYDAGQEDCGEFGNVRGFDAMFEERFPILS